MRTIKSRASLAILAVVCSLGLLGVVAVQPASAVSSRDFTVSLSPASVSINAGGSATVRINVTRGRKFRNSLTYAVGGSVSGLRTSVQLAPGGASIALAAMSDGGSSSGQLEVRVSGGGRVRTAILSVQVVGAAVPAPAPPTTKPAAGEFSVSVDQPTVNMVTGSTSVVAVLVNASGGYTGSPRFEVTGLPTGVTGAFVSPSNPFGTNLTLAASGTVLRGDYPIVVTATDGTRVRQASILLKITVANPFTLVASFETTRTAPGTTVNLKVAVVGTPGAQAPDVDLTISGIPSGTSSPAVIRTSTAGTFVVTFAASTPESDVIVGVRGVSGGFTATTQAAIRVSARPQVSLASTDLSVSPGGTALYEIIYVAANGVPAPSLVVKGTPAGATNAILTALDGRRYVQVVTTAATPKGVYAMTLETQSGAIVTPIPFTLLVV